MGHDTGDAVLRNVASRIRSGIPARATVARLGGDDLGVILPFGPVGDQRDDGDRPPRGAPPTYFIRWQRVGLLGHHRLIPPIGHYGDTSSLLKNADFALYVAKMAGRGRSAAFVPAMRESLHRHVAVLRLARDALARDAVLPFYQLKVCLVKDDVACILIVPKVHLVTCRIE